MKVVLEIVIPETCSTEELEDLAGRAIRAMDSGGHGPKVYPRLLVELGPNYLEIPLRNLIRPD